MQRPGGLVGCLCACLEASRGRVVIPEVISGSNLSLRGCIKVPKTIKIYSKLGHRLCFDLRPYIFTLFYTKMINL